MSFFDTDAYPVQYANSTLVVSNYTLTWPDFRKANAYAWMQWDSGNANNDPRESAISVITMVNQEWGPASTNPTDAGTTIPDVVLGTVPTGADHILVRVRATRTTNPSQINGNTIPTEIEPGQWTIAYGGTLPFEQLYPIGRMIYVYLAATDNGDGTRNVMLRRLMTVEKRRQGFYRSGNDYNKTGWNFGGTYGSAYGIPVSQRGVIPANTDITGVGGRYRRNGSSPAPTNDNTNYSSVYNVDFEIIPGRSNITPVSGSGGSDTYFGLVDEQVSQATASTHTVPINLGDADSTRKIIVGVTTYWTPNSASTTREITSVTIGGVPATRVAYRRSTLSGANHVIAGIYIADVPTGTSGNVVVTTSGGNTSGASVTAWAGYHMQSSVPDSVIESASANTDIPLATATNGIAVAVGLFGGNLYANLEYYQIDMLTYSVLGMPNPALWPSLPDASTGGIAYSRNFDLTQGGTLSVRMAYGSPSTPLAAWVAASFH